MDGELDLPIDIHYNKLLGCLARCSSSASGLCTFFTDWLIDRRHCNAKWTAQVRCIREKIQLSVPSLPPVQLATLSDRAGEGGRCHGERMSITSHHASALNYFQCQDILEAVKAVDGDSKSLFGKYSSSRVQVAEHVYSLPPV